MAEKSCVYISSLSRSDSPPNDGAEVVFETLVVPVMRSFTDFELIHYQFEPEPGSINRAFLGHVMSADLVIADLTELTSNGFYELGMRHASQLPTILMAQDDHPIPFDHKDFRFVIYQYKATDDETEQRTRENLVEAIREVLQTVPTAPGLNFPTKTTSPRETRHELASRIQDAADAIQSLRINSAGDVVASLQKIAADLEAIEDEKTPSAMKEAGEKVLKVLSRIGDQLATVKGSRIIVAGIISLVLGGAGYPGATIYGLTLAFWQGPEIFSKAIEAMTKRKN
jgi:nucleoside 2-deoxyribosyltransferase